MEEDSGVSHVKLTELSPGRQCPQAILAGRNDGSEPGDAAFQCLRLSPLSVKQYYDSFPGLKGGKLPQPCESCVSVKLFNQITSWPTTFVHVVS